RHDHYPGRSEHRPRAHRCRPGLRPRIRPNRLAGRRRLSPLRPHPDRRLPRPPADAARLTSPRKDLVGNGGSDRRGLDDADAASFSFLIQLSEIPVSEIVKGSIGAEVVMNRALVAAGVLLGFVLAHWLVA